MSSIVIVTFDLEYASSSAYPRVREGLEALGLSNQIIRLIDRQIIPLPSNTFFKEYQVGEPALVRDAFQEDIRNVFRRCHVNGPIFIGVGQNWAWIRSEV